MDLLRFAVAFKQTGREGGILGPGLDRLTWPFVCVLITAACAPLVVNHDFRLASQPARQPASLSHAAIPLSNYVALELVATKQAARQQFNRKRI